MRPQTQISVSALVRRINRELTKRDERLKKSRGMRALIDLGEYWIHDIGRNFVAGKDIDPERLGRELEVLRPWEKVIEPKSPAMR
jgi:hypothetical protein